MRRLRLLAIAAVASLALAACAASADTWTYAPASPATPVPSAASSASAGASAAASLEATGSAAPSAGASSGSGAQTIELAAQNIAFDQSAIKAPAGQAFQIKFHNADAGVPHNVAIKDASGAVVFKGDIFAGDDTRTYDVPALQAGTYQFICQVHASMVGTLTVGG